MILILHRYQIGPVSLYIPPLDGGDGQRILKAPHRTVSPIYPPPAPVLSAAFTLKTSTSTIDSNVVHGAFYSVIFVN